MRTETVPPNKTDCIRVIKETSMATEAPSLRSLAIRASAWTVAGHGAGQILRLGANLIMTRLLVPEMFGLMAIVTIILVGLQMFSDVGTGPSIIQSKHGDDPAFLNTAWTIQIIRGASLWLIVGLLSGGFLLLGRAEILPQASVYADPLLPAVLLVSGVNALIAGFNPTKIFSANRELVIGKLTLLEVISQMLAIAIMILWAMFSPTIWALVAGSIVGSLSKMLLSHALLPGLRNHLHWDREAVGAQFHFGKWIFLSSIISFVTQNGDRLILGVLLTASELGVYAIAFFLVEAVARVVSRLSHRVWFPVFGKVARENRAKLKAQYYRIRLLQDAAILPLAGILIMAGDRLIDLLYDSRYAEAGWMLQILAIRLAISPVLTASSAIFMAIGHPKINTITLSLRGAFLWIFLPLLYGSFGITGAVWTVSSSLLIAVPIIIMALKKYELITWHKELRAIPLFALGLGVGKILVL